MARKRTKREHSLRRHAAPSLAPAPRRERDDNGGVAAAAPRPGIPLLPAPFPLTVLAERSLQALTPRFSVERGDAYFAQGRVGTMEAYDGTIETTVRGSYAYHVMLAVEEDAIFVRCQCAFYLRSFETCKHIWAAIRAALARNLLPDRKFAAVIHDDVEDEIVLDTIQPRRTALWERFLQAIGPARGAMPHAPRNVPE